jgi:hypothetical protein
MEVFMHVDKRDSVRLDPLDPGKNQQAPVDLKKVKADEIKAKKVELKNVDTAIKNETKTLSSHGEVGDATKLDALKTTKADLKFELDQIKGSFQKTSVISSFFRTLKKIITDIFVPRKTFQGLAPQPEAMAKTVEIQVKAVIEKKLDKAEAENMDAGGMEYINKENMSEIGIGLNKLGLKPTELNIIAADMLVENKQEFTLENFNSYKVAASEEHPDLAEKVKSTAPTPAPVQTESLEKTAEKSKKDMGDFFDKFNADFQRSVFDLEDSSPQQQYIEHLLKNNNESGLLNLGGIPSDKFVKVTKEEAGTGGIVEIRDNITAGREKDFMDGYNKFLNA